MKQSRDGRYWGNSFMPEPPVAVARAELAEARAECAMAADLLKWYAEEARRIHYSEAPERAIRGSTGTNGCWSSRSRYHQTSP